MKCLLKQNLVSELKDVRAELFKNIQLPLLLSNGSLYNLLAVAKSVRDFPLERDIPKDVRSCMVMK